ncbi:MAG: hypothetical protein ACXW32_07635 [Limisphaerales bacterium]
MKLLTFAWSITAALWLSLPPALAQVPPAEQLLPDDTIAILSVPDWTKLTANYNQAAWGQLWVDPAMKPFRDNFNSNFQSDFIQPLEKELGVKLADYQQLLQGQITLAATPPKEGTTDLVSLMVLIDTKDKSELLTTKLAELKKKWTEAGKELKTEKIRDIEFNSISFSSKDVQALFKKAFPSADEAEAEEPDEDAAPEEKQQFRIGQYKSLLIIGENPSAIEKLLARQTGGLVAPLGEKAEYQKSHNLLFRESLGHVWLNVKPIYEKVLQMASKEQEAPPTGMPALQPDKILPALGFSSIDSISARLGGSADGSVIEFMLGAPEGRREGIFKLLTIEKKDAAPPGFVPADVTKFQRTRVDSQKAWATLESIVSKIDPSMAGLLQLMLSSAGKDKDPNFDLKKNLIGNLGDDFIQYEKAPKTAKLDQIQSPPSLTLIGSPDPAALLDALRMITSLLPPPLSTAPLKEREFLGKKIYTLSLAAAPQVLDEETEDAPPGAPPAATTQSFSFTSSAGYLALSNDDSLLEEYLRSGESPPKPLRSVTGFAEAAQKAGGMENGFFSYENQVETLRITMDMLKNNPDALSQLPFLGGGEEDEEGGSAFNRLFNIKLLPSFDRISKYFGIAVASAGTTPEGLHVKVVAQKPAGLK